MNRSVVRSLALVVALAGSSVAVRAQAGLEPCTVMDREAACGTINVPEDRANPTGRQISLNVTVIKAPAPREPDAVLFFAGGPGQGAAVMAPQVAAELIAAAPTRDIVLIDQRGTGRSRPLNCDGGFMILDTGRWDDLAKCAEALRAVADLDDFGSDESADDAAEVVRLLGYPQVNVIGVSYGTRLAGRFVARHPALVRTVVLRAMAPPGFNILREGASGARTALALLIADCRADADCSGAFPDLERDLETLRAQLEKTGNPISAELLDMTLYALMLSAQTRQAVPWVVHSAVEGNMLPLGAIANQVQAVYGTVALGAYMSIVCAEDAPELTAEERRDLQAGFNAGTATVLAGCERWPVAVAPSPIDVPPMPTLAVSGALDPAMPPPVVDRALQGHANARHLVLPATAHGPTFPGCSTGLVKTFIDSRGTAPLNTDCLKDLTLPPFRR